MQKIIKNPVRRAGVGLSRVIVLNSSILLLAGCAAPVNPVSVLSTIADGISYATTGKSSTDHVVSGVMEEDCAVHRALADKDICKPSDAKSKEIRRIDHPQAENQAADDRD